MLKLKADDIDSLQSILSLTLSRLKRPKLWAHLATIEHRSIPISVGEVAQENASVGEPEDDLEQMALDLDELT